MASQTSDHCDSCAGIGSAASQSRRWCYCCISEGRERGVGADAGGAEGGEGGGAGQAWGWGWTVHFTTPAAD